MGINLGGGGDAPLIRDWVFRQAIVPLLFRELALSPALCRLLRRLEIRVYPLSMILKERLAVEQQAVLILRQGQQLLSLHTPRSNADQRLGNSYWPARTPLDETRISNGQSSRSNRRPTGPSFLRIQRTYQSSARIMVCRAPHYATKTTAFSCNHARSKRSLSSTLGIGPPS